MVCGVGGRLVTLLSSCRLNLPWWSRWVPAADETICCGCITFNNMVALWVCETYPYLGGAAPREWCLQPWRAGYPFIHFHTRKSERNCFLRLIRSHIDARLDSVSPTFVSLTHSHSHARYDYESVREIRSHEEIGYPFVGENGPYLGVPWQGNMDVSRIPSFAIMLVIAAVMGEGWSSVATPVSWYGSRRVGLRLQPWRLFDVKLQNAIAARKLKEESRKQRSRFRFGLTGPDYALKFVKGKSSKPFGRLWWDEIVSTVVTRPQPHNQAILHRVQGRVLTIR
nr:DNA (cytosine-5)-methyltransferase CMT3-like [Tanacetum cinerariifolium]